MPRDVSKAWSLLCLVSMLLLSTPSYANAEASTQLFEEATSALSRGAFDQAIAGYEQLSDLGVHSAAASYNRALAYLQRAETPKRHPGDLGQAAAALREASDAGLESESGPLLSLVREEIARQRARSKRDPLAAEAPLGWAITALAPENVWAWMTGIGCLLLTVGLWLRRARVDSPLRLSANISTGIGLGMLLLFGTLTASAQHLRQTVHEAVVVANEAPLLDERGKPVRGVSVGADANEIPEGASVYVLEQRSNLARIRWGSAEAWISTTQIRSLQGA